jgi:hypothetical protein
MTIRIRNSDRPRTFLGRFGKHGRPSRLGAAATRIQQTYLEKVGEVGRLVGPTRGFCIRLEPQPYPRIPRDSYSLLFVSTTYVSCTVLLIPEICARKYPILPIL